MALFAKKPKGRWGKKFVDKRDWVVYNEELVVRGEFLLELDWVKSWDDELEKMNEGKRGAPYEFPESLIKLQAVWHQWADYRGIEGITRKLAEHGLVPKHNDHTTVNRRVNKMNIDFELPNKGTVSVSCDGSGMKLTNGGEYRDRKYGKKKGNMCKKCAKKGKERRRGKKKRKEKKRYVKVTITADPKTKRLLGVDVSIEGEGPSEPDVAKSHMEDIMENGTEIEKFWGDGSFDKIELFNFCEEHDIETAIKIRKNAAPKEEESERRFKEAEDYQKDGYKKWARKNKYGDRWPGTEGIFSAVKRKFGENIRSRKLPNIFHEAKSKFWAYQNMKDYAAS